MILRLDHLPEEILHIILCYCHPRSSAALGQTSSRLRKIANEPLLWRYYCQSHFKFWDPRHDIRRKFESPVSVVDWKGLYISRYSTDHATSELLDSILTSQTGRLEKIRAVIGFGYDIKDGLLRHISAGSDIEDYLARRYYAKVLLTCLHRSIAVQEWAKLRNGDTTVSLERALGAFDLFVPESGFGNLDEIVTRLDEIASQIFICCPNIMQLTTREKACAVAAYLRASNLTGIRMGREYHCLQHNFLGFALNDPEHNSLPLISAAIYCYVARKINLDAQLCGFPFHVHVIVMPPTGLDFDGNILAPTTRIEPIYMDPFRSERGTPIENLQNQLNILGASAVEQSTFLGASGTTDIVLRCGKNILNSIQHLSQFPDVQPAAVDVVGAKYAALWSFLLLATPHQPAELRHYLPWLMELFTKVFPSDIYIIEQYIVPLFKGTLEYGHILETLHVMRAVDEIPKQVRRRTLKHTGVRYKIGQVFRHRRYNYTAIITGWDTECDAGEQWMRRMGIDRLEIGRHQSFYHVLAEDTSVRYVAEENVELITPQLSELPQMLMEVAGKHFKRWNSSSRVFISNIRDEYPDD